MRSGFLELIIDNDFDTLFYYCLTSLVIVWTLGSVHNGFWTIAFDVKPFPVCLSVGWM